MIPMALVYIIIMTVFILVWFMLVKRPVYEAMFLSFILLVGVTNTWGQMFSFINGAMNTSLLYSMLAFVAMSQLLAHTRVIDSCIYLIISCLGRLRGGAGYATLIASSFMGALSGSGPGNVMATGVITVPAMKQSGFPAHLAANVVSCSSCMGNMIPPSSNIVSALGAFMILYPNSDVTSGQFWIILWGISIYFIIQRAIMIWGFCKYYKVDPLPKEKIPSLKETFRTGWQGLMLPVIILVPFLVDSALNATFLTDRLGKAGAGYFSKSLLFFIAGVAAMYALVITPDKKSITPAKLIDVFTKGAKSLVGPISTCTFGYMLGELFAYVNVTDDLAIFLENLDLSRLGLAIIIPLFTAFLGMVIPGSSQVVIFGPLFISVFAATGSNPLFVAAMLPCICGAMAGITPPLALCMYAGMSIAQADFKKTVINDLWWCVAQYVLEVVMLLEVLPIIGL